MISAIIIFIIKIINFILSFIISLIFSIFPTFNFSQFTNIFSEFWGLMGNALNLLYFCSGPILFLLGDIIIVLWTLKHIALPMINFVRKILIR